MAVTFIASSHMPTQKCAKAFANRRTIDKRLARQINRYLTTTRPSSSACLQIKNQNTAQLLSSSVLDDVTIVYLKAALIYHFWQRHQNDGHFLMVVEIARKPICHLDLSKEGRSTSVIDSVPKMQCVLNEPLSLFITNRQRGTTSKVVPLNQHNMNTHFQCLLFLKPLHRNCLFYVS